MAIIGLGLNSCKDNEPKYWFKAGSHPESYGNGMDRSDAQNGQESGCLLSDYA